jgi:hypothetical protein
MASGAGDIRPARVAQFQIQFARKFATYQHSSSSLSSLVLHPSTMVHRGLKRT